MKLTRQWAGLVTIGSCIAVAATAHTIYNLTRVRKPSVDAVATSDTVSVLIPARNERSTIEACLTSVAEVHGISEVLVLDDGSTDETATIIERCATVNPLVTVLKREATAVVPPGWTGKSWACEELASAATGSVLVFLDADVTLEQSAIVASVAMLREANVDLVCPYPRQITAGLLSRLVQPLLQWSWLTFVPLQASEKSSRELLAVANGQFLVVDAQAYRNAGGHRSVRGDVLEDVALARAVRAAGGHTAVVEGSDIATCQMYSTTSELIDGYAKSLWSAFGSGLASIAVVKLLGVAYVTPPLAVIVGPTRRVRTIGLLGYSAGVAGRIAVARTTHTRVLPESLLHPLSIAAFAGLVAESWRRKRNDSIKWKGRALPVR